MGKAREGLKLGAVLVCALAALYGIAACRANPPDLRSLNRGEMSKLAVAVPPRAAPMTRFTDAEGHPHTLADYRGQVVVVNVWASWCAPCRTELPSLGRLQAAYADRGVRVVAMTVDRDTDMDAARRFLATAPPLAMYRTGYDFLFGLTPRAQGVPITLIYDRQGRERARLEGGASWSGQAARRVIDAVLAGA
jgi:thiol-disulfide isomerase/thioredoxin